MVRYFQTLRCKPQQIIFVDVAMLASLEERLELFSSPSVVIFLSARRETVSLRSGIMDCKFADSQF